MKITTKELSAKWYEYNLPKGYYCYCVRTDGTLSDERIMYCGNTEIDKIMFLDEYVKQCNENLKNKDFKSLYFFYKKLLTRILINDIIKIVK